MISVVSPRRVQDQASGLRSLMARQGPRLIAVCEADDGERRGVASGLAGALGRQGQAVLLVDENRPDRMRRWLPGASNGAEHAVLPLAAPPATLPELVAAQEGERLHVVLVAVAANVEAGRWSALAAQAQDAVIVLPGNDPSGASLTAAYAMIKQLHSRHPGMLFRVLVTDCDAESRAYRVFCRLATVAARYLTVRLSFIGYLPILPEAAKEAATPAMLRAYDRVASNVPLWTR